MIDIDKLTEAQVRYLLQRLIYGTSVKVSFMEDCIFWFTTEDDYPQQTNNEESNNDY
jgi:hypothetical protein